MQRGKNVQGFVLSQHTYYVINRFQVLFVVLSLHTPVYA